ncbi:hypothetical protein BDR05DRAFT_999411 [Suillus weaverae]|nr:hypothetical protein BDR05DRAFT_999411 [Suillus weaverae]
MHTSEPIVVSMWDAANIFEYATTHFTTIWMVLDKSHVPRTLVFQRKFVWHIVWEAKKFIYPFINICTTSNTSPALPKYLNNVAFWSSQWDLLGDLIAQYQVILTFQYSWWKDYQSNLLCSSSSYAPSAHEPSAGNGGGVLLPVDLLIEHPDSLYSFAQLLAAITEEHPEPTWLAAAAAERPPSHPEVAYEYA